jgi:hypothetical protein
MRTVQRTVFEKPEEQILPERFRRICIIILKWLLKKQDGRVWTRML